MSRKSSMKLTDTSLSSFVAEAARRTLQRVEDTDGKGFLQTKNEAGSTQAQSQLQRSKSERAQAMLDWINRPLNC